MLKIKNNEPRFFEDLDIMPVFFIEKATLSTEDNNIEGISRLQSAIIIISVECGQKNTKKIISDQVEISLAESTDTRPHIPVSIINHKYKPKINLDLFNNLDNLVWSFKLQIKNILLSDDEQINLFITNNNIPLNDED